MTVSERGTRLRSGLIRGGLDRSGPEPQTTKGLLSKSFGLVAVALLSSAALGCSSDSLPGNGSGGGANVDPMGNVGGAGNPGGTDPLGTGGAFVPTVEGAVDPGTKGVHRLNDEDYNNSVQDLFEDPSLAPARGWLPGQAYGFDNIAEVLGINDGQYEKYFGSATTLADSVFARPDQVAKIVTCTPDVAGCAQSIVEAFGLRVWRRPLDAAEIATMVKVYDNAITAGEDHTNAVKQVVRAFLSSPQFIYRMEFDADPTSVAPHVVNQYELASRLSYFLWSSTPDDALLALAGAGGLTDPTAIAAQVEQMLASPKSERLTRNFAGQWLSLRKVASHIAFPKLFPDWNPALGESMATEAYSYFSEFLRSDLPWTDFVRADINFIDANLATHYGMAAPATEGFTRVTVADDQRFGFFGLGAYLTLSSLPQRTSPTMRAKQILKYLMCTEPPAPPPDVAKAVEEKQMEDEATGGEITDIKAWLEKHREEPACASCHAIFDPYGMALENFDAIGKYRTAYPDGAPVDSVATLLDGTVMTGLAGVVDAVSADPRLTTCVAKQLFVYGLGRGMAPTDDPYMTDLLAKWQAGTPTLKRLVQELAVSDPFRTRHGEGAN